MTTKFKKFKCSYCDANNDVDISFIYSSGNGWIRAFGTEICWYCKKRFDWELENKNYGK